MAEVITGDHRQRFLAEVARLHREAAARDGYSARARARAVLEAAGKPLAGLSNLVGALSGSARQLPHPDLVDDLADALELGGVQRVEFVSAYSAALLTLPRSVLSRMDPRQKAALPAVLTCARCGAEFEPSREQAYRSAADPGAAAYCPSCKPTAQADRRQPTLNDQPVVAFLEGKQAELGLSDAALGREMGWKPSTWSRLRRTPGQVPETEMYELVVTRFPDAPPRPHDTPTSRAAARGLAKIHDLYGDPGSEAARQHAVAAGSAKKRRPMSAEARASHSAARLRVLSALDPADSRAEAERLRALARTFEQQVHSSIRQTVSWWARGERERGRTSTRPLPDNPFTQADKVRWADGFARRHDVTRGRVLAVADPWLRERDLLETRGRPPREDICRDIERLKVDWRRGHTSEDGFPIHAAVVLSELHSRPNFEGWSARQVVKWDREHVCTRADRLPDCPCRCGWPVASAAGRGRPPIYAFARCGDRMLRRRGRGSTAE